MGATQPNLGTREGFLSGGTKFPMGPFLKGEGTKENGGTVVMGRTRMGKEQARWGRMATAGIVFGFLMQSLGLPAYMMVAARNNTENTPLRAQSYPPRP